MNPHKLTITGSGDLVGPAKHLRVKPYCYSCHVYRAGVSSMGGTQKLSPYVERTRMETNLRNHSKTSESRKEPLHKS